MAQLAEIENRIASMGELKSILGAMRALAVIRMQEARQALAGVRRYAEILAHGVGQATLLMDGQREFRGEGTGRIIVAFLSEHGFVGGFNARLLDTVSKMHHTPAEFLVVGTRGAGIALERSLPLTWTQPMATRIEGALETARAVAGELYKRISCGTVGQVTLVYGQSRQASTPEPTRKSVLPLDLANLKHAANALTPIHHLKPAVLLERLVAEYIFAQLAEAAVEAQASENAARFFAVEAARDNVTKKLAQLRQDARQERQEDITNEIVEIVGGAEAVEDAPR